jgi:NTP pyrophosphatase (non-canonical NTP hydrolase)
MSLTINEYANEALRTSQLNREPDLVQEMKKYISEIRDTLNDASGSELLHKHFPEVTSEVYNACDNLEELAEHLENFIRRSYSAFTLAGEVGEFIDALKKDLYHEKPVDGEKVEGELGDVAWSLNYAIAAEGLDTEKVHRANIAKLKKRYPNGYNHADARARRDVADDADGAK